MKTLRQLCIEHTKLTPADIGRLEALERDLPLIADVSNADVFLDCLIDEQTASVVAQATPSLARTMTILRSSWALSPPACMLRKASNAL